jgi:hypothetical protein
VLEISVDCGADDGGQQKKKKISDVIQKGAYAEGRIKEKLHLFFIYGISVKISSRTKKQEQRDKEANNRKQIEGRLV